MNVRRGKKVSYQCNGEAVRRYRKMKSWTQCHLAKIAGYSERLIIKAEAGKALMLNTIEDLAEALSDENRQLGLSDLIFDPEKIAREYIHCLYTYPDQFVSKIAHFLADDAVFRIRGDKKDVPFAGIHQGIEEITKAFEIFFSVLEVPKGHNYRPHYKFFRNGNEIIIWGNTFIHPIGRPLEKPFTINNLLRFENGKLVEFDDRFDTEQGKQLLAGNG